MRSQLKNEGGKSWDLNHGPLEQKASVLPLSNTDPWNNFYRIAYCNIKPAKHLDLSLLIVHTNALHDLNNKREINPRLHFYVSCLGLYQRQIIAHWQAIVKINFDKNI